MDVTLERRFVPRLRAHLTRPPHLLHQRWQYIEKNLRYRVIWKYKDDVALVPKATSRKVSQRFGGRLKTWFEADYDDLSPIQARY